MFFYPRCVLGRGRSGRRRMVNDVADLFDKAADLCSAAWDHDEPEDGERLWKEYRKTLAAAFDALKPIFHDLDD